MKTLAVCLLLFLSATCARAETYGPYPEETYTTCGSPLDQTAVVLIHGGAWFAGAADSPDVLKLCNYLGLHRVYVMSIDYRPSTVMPWPAQLQDAQLAFRHLRRHSHAKRFGIVGLSAGGQIALSMAFQTRVEYAGTDPSRESTTFDGISSHPDFVVDVSGPTDLTASGLLPAGVATLTRETQMSDEAAKAFASPIVHVTPSTSPLLISHGTEDDLVPVGQSDSLVAALKRSGVSVSMTNSQADGDIKPATVIYDRHRGGHLFRGTRFSPIYAEILRFVKGLTGE